MISSTTSKHQKHTKLTRVRGGEWGRDELAIVGTTCDDVKKLATAIIHSLPSYQIAYVDAGHTSVKASGTRDEMIRSGVFIEFRDDASSTIINISRQPNAFQKKSLLIDCDLVLLNGNHFSASKQIVVIDERKPLEKKLDKLTDIEMIVMKDIYEEIPGYLVQYIPDDKMIPRFSFADTEAICQHIRTYLQQQVPGVNGLVLSGGQSTRMGKDKGSLYYHDRNQRDYVFEILSSHCGKTFISCNSEQSEEITGTPKIEDAFLHLGPLSGILSAFQHNPNIAWLTVACDLPFLNEDTIVYLLTHRNPSKTATAFWDAEGKFPEPLVTIWEPCAYPVLLQFLSQGYSCPRKALIHSDVELLRAPDTSAFVNVNTKEEYDEALSQLQKQVQ